MPRPSRNIPDFKVLNSTGVRVPKVRTKGDKMDEVARLAINSQSDVEDLFESYVIEELEDEDELSDYLTKIEVVKRDFRRIHSQLKAIEGDEDFQKKYPYYDKDLATLNTSFKEVSKKLADLRKKSKSELNDLETHIAEAQIEREKSKHLAVRKCFLQQVEWDLDHYDWENIDDPEEIKCAISKFDKHLENFHKICSDLESCFGEGLDSEIRLASCEMVDSLRDKLNSAKIRLKR